MIAATLTPAPLGHRGVIMITGIGDHFRPEWPITITGMRTSAQPGMELVNAKRFREPYGAPAIHLASETREAVLTASTARLALMLTR